MHGKGVTCVNNSPDFLLLSCLINMTSTAHNHIPWYHVLACLTVTIWNTITFFSMIMPHL